MADGRFLGPGIEGFVRLSFSLSLFSCEYRVSIVLREVGDRGLGLGLGCVPGV